MIFICTFSEEYLFSTHFCAMSAASHHKNSQWHESKPVKYDFQAHANENKTIALTNICKARAWNPWNESNITQSRLSKSVQSLYKVVTLLQNMSGEIHTKITCYVWYED